MAEKDLKNAICVLPNRLYYVALSGSMKENVQNKHFFCTDQELVYWNFYLDFGPLNLGLLYRFCMMLNNKLNDPKLKDKVIYYYSAMHPHRRANSMYLISSWCVLFLKKTPEEAFRPFKGTPAVPPWHDATQGPANFNLTILDTLRGLLKAAQYRFFDFNNFNLAEYEHFEQVENGDLNWCLDNKFVMFAGPHNKKECTPEGYHTLCPDDYIPYFKRKNVELVVRLNKKYYDSRRFTSQGIAHEDLYFIDGSNPPDDILNRFIGLCEETPGAIAVHCKAGLGRTGCVIGGYIMKHYQFTAEELIGWLRIVRPGSIIGPQQQYMQDIQMRMWQDGEVYRATIATMAAPRTRGDSNGGSNNDPSALPGIKVSNKNTKSITASPIVTTHKTAAAAGSAGGGGGSGGVSALTDKMRGVSVSPPPISGSGGGGGGSGTNSGTSSPTYSLFNRDKSDPITQGDELMRRRNEMKAEHMKPPAPMMPLGVSSDLTGSTTNSNSNDNSSADVSSSSINTLGTTSSSLGGGGPISRVGKILSSTFSPSPVGAGGGNKSPAAGAPR